MQSLRQDLVNIFVTFGPWTFDDFNRLKDSLTEVEEEDPLTPYSLQFLDPEDYEAQVVEDCLINALSDAWHLFSAEELKKIQKAYSHIASKSVPKELDRLERGQFMAVFEDRDPQFIADLAREYIDRVQDGTVITPQMTKALIRLIDALKTLPK